MSLLRGAWALARDTISGFHRDRCFDQAALVSFYCLLSLAPCLYVAAVVVAHVVPGPDPFREALSRLAPLLAPNAVEALSRLIEHDLTTGTPVVALALPGLVWAATAGLRALERAISSIFTAGERKSGLGGRLRALALLLAFLTGLGGAHLVDALVLRAGILGQGLAALASRLVLLGIRFATFVLVYRLLPRGGTAWRLALSGALVALPLWEIARRGFGLVLGSLPSFGLVNGTLAGIVTLELWFFAATAIVLLGAEFAAALGRRA